MRKLNTLRTGLYYGWWMVITLAITETISWGVVYYAYSVIITALEGEFGERVFLADGEDHAVMQRHIGDGENGQIIFPRLVKLLEKGFQFIAPRREAVKITFFHLRDADGESLFGELLAIGIEDFIRSAIGDERADSEEFIREFLGIHACDAAEPSEHFTIQQGGGGRPAGAEAVAKGLP